MRKVVIAVLSVLALAGTSSVALAAPPDPDPASPSCHGLAMGNHSSTNGGVGQFAKENGISVIDAHFVFMAEHGCPE